MNSRFISIFLAVTTLLLAFLLGTLWTLEAPSWNLVAEERVVSENYLSKVYAASNPEIFPGNNVGNRMIDGFGNIGMGKS